MNSTLKVGDRVRVSNYEGDKDHPCVGQEFMLIDIDDGRGLSYRLKNDIQSDIGFHKSELEKIIPKPKRNTL